MFYTDQLNLKQAKVEEERDVLNSKGSGIDWQKVKDIGTDVSRYAAPITNALQLLGLKRPQKEQLPTMGNRYRKQLVDEKALMNSIDSAFAPGLSSENSGGSSSRKQSMDRALQRDKMKAKSDAYLQATDRNNQEGRAEQEFNANIDRFNTVTVNWKDNIS